MSRQSVQAVDRRVVEEMIREREWELLTRTDGPTMISDDARRYVALIRVVDRLLLIVAASHSMHHEVSTVRSLLRKKGTVCEAEYHVDMSVIAALYDRFPRISRNASPLDNVVLMQRKFLDLVRSAAERNASDIHVTIRHNAPAAIVRFRLDGVLVPFGDLANGVAQELCQAAFNMSDVSDPTYMPMEQQGARISQSDLRGAQFPAEVQSLRLQFSPLAAGGRYMVVRLLYHQRTGSDDDVDTLGYSQIQIRQIREMRRRPQGINIVSGPTGSGKSTTLQRSLVALMRERLGINVVTIEDPPEYTIDGAQQIPVSNAKTAEERSEKFRQAITGTLRLDPDVIMIGEIRDRVSAHLAFEAAMTGHGLWTTLHTNDAISILDRLRDMGVDLYKLTDASLVTGLIGQRLVRRTRPETSISWEEGCKLGYLDEETIELIRRLAPNRCRNIRFAGTDRLTDLSKFAGRTVVAETIVTDQTLLDFIKAEEKPKAIRYWLDHLQGVTMLEHVFHKVLLGIVDPREAQDKIGPFSGLDQDRIRIAMALLDEESIEP